MLMMESDPKTHYHGVGRKANGDQKSPWLTIMPSIRWLALGHYRAKTGGMDTISTNQEMMDALKYAWKYYPSYDILMEGIIASTIRSTYIDMFKDYQKRSRNGLIDPPRTIIVVNFLPPLKTCIKRVKERNGGKPVKEDQIESKWNTVMRNVPYFREAGLKTLKVNTAKIKKDEMVDKFNIIVNKYRGDLYR